MSDSMIGLVMVFIAFALFMLLMIAIVRFIPDSFLGLPAKAVLRWMPPFLRGHALRKWAATVAEASAEECLSDNRTGERGARLAREVEEIAMQAMLPMAEKAELGRVVACPEAGQGLVGVTVPEVLAIAAYIRKHKSRAELNRLHDLAVENAKIISARSPGDNRLEPLPCALQGEKHVCCAFAARPLHCRPLHAISLAKDLGSGQAPPADSPDAGNDPDSHQKTVAQGIEIGMIRALKSAGLDANLYELNSALATALENPDAEERWARRENLFHDPLPVRPQGSDASDQSG